MNKKALFIKYILDSKNTEVNDGFETLWTGELSVTGNRNYFSTDNLYRGKGIYRLELSEYNFRSFVYNTFYDSSRYATISKQGDKVIIDITVHNPNSATYIDLGKFATVENKSSGSKTTQIWISTGTQTLLDSFTSTSSWGSYSYFALNPVTPTDNTLMPTTITRIAYSPLP